MSTETFIMVEGNPMPASLQPPFPALQSAFRNSSGRITIDLVAARNVARDIIRRERAPLFERNDVAALNATLRKDDAAVTAILDRGDALRNSTRDPRIESASSPEALLATTDTIISELKNLF